MKTETVKYTNTGDAVTITVQGAAYKNLVAIADAMNAVAWCDNDNAPESILSLLIGDLVDDLSSKARYYEHIPTGGIANVADEVCSAIDTGAEPDTAEDRGKRDELRREFSRRGLLSVA